MGIREFLKYLQQNYYCGKFNCKNLSIELNVPVHTVSRRIVALKKQKIIYLDPKHEKYYRLNPDYIIKD